MLLVFLRNYRSRIRQLMGGVGNMSLDAKFAVQWRTSEQYVPSYRMAEQDVLLNGIRRLVKSQCVIAETLTFHRVANPHRVDDFFAFVFCAVIFLGG